MVLTWEAKIIVVAVADGDVDVVAETNWKHKVTPDWGHLKCRTYILWSDVGVMSKYWLILVLNGLHITKLALLKLMMIIITDDIPNLSGPFLHTQEVTIIYHQSQFTTSLSYNFPETLTRGIPQLFYFKSGFLKFWALSFITIIASTQDTHQSCKGTWLKSKLCLHLKISLQEIYALVSGKWKLLKIK